MNRRESDLSSPVCSWLSTRGYTAYCEVPVQGTCVDVVAQKGDEIVAVELKISLSSKVIRQALLARNFADQAWCAVFTKPRSLAIPNKLGIGVLRIINGKAHVLLEPEPQKPFGGLHSEMMRTLAMCEPGGVGGLSNTINDGPAQQVARLVAPLRKRNIGWREIYDQIPNHYANWRSMRSVMNGYGPAKAIIRAAVEAGL